MNQNKLKTLIVISIILTLIMVLIIRERQHLDKLIYYNEVEIQQEEARLKVSQELIKNYNELLANYDELYLKYEGLTAENGFYQGWELYEVTAYTSKDDGCNDFAATKININKLSEHFNFCAVDTSIIPYGSIVLVKFDTGIKPFLAVDTGQAIKGKHIDLYFVNDLDSAFEFGNRYLEVKVISNAD